MSHPALPWIEFAVLEAWFEIAPDAMLAVAADGRIVLANMQAEQVFGYAAHGLRGLSLEALVPASARPAHHLHRADFAARPRVRAMGADIELSALRKDGHEFPVEIGLSPVATAQGPLTITAVRDISDTRRVRQAQERTRRDALLMQIGRLALESPEYEHAIRQIPALVARALAVPMVAIFSTGWHRDGLHVRSSTGLDAQAVETLASTFGEVRFIRSTFIAGGPEAVTTDTLRDPAYAAIRARLIAAGFNDMAMVPLFGRDEPLGALIALAPDPVGFDRDKVGFLQAVANLLAAAVQRSRSEEQLAHAQRLDAVGQLTGGVAHDFNNLLTVISGNLQLLEAELPDHPQAHETIDAALRAVDRGANLTRRLLAFARRQPLQPRAVVPKPLLEELGHMLRRTLGEPVTVEVECEAGVADVYADANELDTALVNLALNARDAMPRGGRLLIRAREVSIDSPGNEWRLPPGRYVAIDVSDTGTGMSPEIEARALEPFFTTKEAGKGSGLGLSMVYGFVTQSGGAMAIDSRLGYGTRIELLLPVAASGRAGVAKPASEAVPVRHGTILVVEDEAEVRAIAARFLAASGYRVVTAATGHEALTLLRSRDDVVVLFSDVVLGNGMDGVELANEARRTRPALPVLLTSGYEGSAGSHGPGTDIEGYPLLRKPYRREQLVAAIGLILGPA